MEFSFFFGLVEHLKHTHTELKTWNFKVQKSVTKLWFFNFVVDLFTPNLKMHQTLVYWYHHVHTLQKTIPVLFTSLFFKFLPTSLSFCLSLHSFCCIFSLTECTIVLHLMCYFTYWYYFTPGTLVLKAPCYVFYTKRLLHYAPVGLIHMTLLLLALLLYLSLSHTHTHTHTPNTQGQIDWHINIF